MSPIIPQRVHVLATLSIALISSKVSAGPDDPYGNCVLGCQQRPTNPQGGDDNYATYNEHACDDDCVYKENGNNGFTGTTGMYCKCGREHTEGHWFDGKDPQDGAHCHPQDAHKADPGCGHEDHKNQMFVPDAQIFDDPHVRTLSGNQYFMHGVGVFDYASIPGVITTQVYMCPFAPCTAAMDEAGECLTFIQAVAIKIENVHPSQAHTLILRNSSLRVDAVDRKGEANVTLGPQMSIKASGTGAATDNAQNTERVDHESLADCHVLPTSGAIVPDEPLATKDDQPATVAMKRAAHQGGGTWKACTANEWTLTVPDLTIEVGVIGPFEKGYLNEGVSDRTFNLNVKAVEEKKKQLKGIINGDTNGYFVLDPKFNDGKSDNLEPGTMVPLGPHGNVQEVTAPNVAAKNVLFPAEALLKMDELCGAKQSLRAIRMAEGESPSELKQGWKKFKSSPK